MTRSIVTLAWFSYLVLFRGQSFRIALLFLTATMAFGLVASTWASQAQAKIVFDVAMLGFHLLGSAFAIFWGVQSVAESRLDGTIEVQLAGPISPALWLIGRFLGVICSLTMLSLCFVLIGQACFILAGWGSLPAAAIAAFTVQTMGWWVVAALAVYFASFCGMETAVFATSGAWIIGLSTKLVAASLPSGTGPWIRRCFDQVAVVWDLQRFNALPTDLAAVDIEVFAWSLGYGLMLSILILTLSCAVFSRRDVVL